MHPKWGYCFFLDTSRTFFSSSRPPALTCITYTTYTPSHYKRFSNTQYTLHNSIHYRHYTHTHYNVHNNVWHFRAHTHTHYTLHTTQQYTLQTLHTTHTHYTLHNNIHYRHHTLCRAPERADSSLVNHCRRPVCCVLGAPQTSRPRILALAGIAEPWRGPTVAS